MTMPRERVGFIVSYTYNPFVSRLIMPYNILGGVDEPADSVIRAEAPPVDCHRPSNTSKINLDRHERTSSITNNDGPKPDPDTIST